MGLESSQILMVIPLFNHGGTVRSVVEKALACNWPVLVVDDGSTDGGADQIAGLDCHLIALGKNSGKGAAIMAGAGYAMENGYRAIITVDADGQLDPAEASILAEVAVEQWPALVVGARVMDKDNAPGASLFGRAFSNFWVRLECGRELPDTQSGFRLYPVKELMELAVGCRRYDFEVEVLTRSGWAGLPILSVPVSVHYPPPSERESHFHQFRDNFRLTCLHTRLVTRALLPWPHKKLAPGNGSSKEEDLLGKLSMLHPVHVIKTLCREHSSALQLASAAWMGIFLGALPLIACHTVVILYVCHRLHLNKLAAVTASQLCMPPVVPVLCIQVGFFIRHGSFLWTINWDTMVLQIHYRLWEWLLGSLLLGPALGFFVGALVYLGIRKTRKGRDEASDLLERG